MLFLLPRKNFGGMEYSAQKLINYFVSLLSLDVAVMVRKGGRNDTPYSNCDSSSVSIVGMYLRLLSTFKDRCRTLVVTNSAYSQLCVMLCPFKINCVYQLHCTIDFNSDISQIKKMLLKWYVAMASWRAKIFCVSESLAEEVSSYSFINSANVYFSPNVLDRERVRPVRPEKCVSFVGRFCDQKCPDRAVRVFDLLIKSDAAWQCFMIGSGDHEDRLKSKISEAIVWKGWVEQPFLYGGVLLFTSQYEGYGLVIIEALMNGYLVVARDAPHGPEDILRRIDKDMLLPFDAADNDYAVRIDNILKKYRDEKQCDMLLSNISQYMDYLDSVRKDSWILCL